MMNLFMFLALVVLGSGAGCASFRYGGYEKKFMIEPVESAWRVEDPPVLTEERAWQTVDYNSKRPDLAEKMDIDYRWDGYSVCFDEEEYFIFITHSKPAYQKGFAVEKETGRLYRGFRRGIWSSPKWVEVERPDHKSQSLGFSGLLIMIEDCSTLFSILIIR